MRYFPANAAVSAFLLGCVLTASSHCTAAEVEIRRLPLNAKSLVDIPLLFDRGFSSPFIVQVDYYKALANCPKTDGRIVALKISDFGEAPDQALYCLLGVGTIVDLKLESALDDQSEVGKAVILNIRAASGKTMKSLRLRSTPWASTLEGNTTEKP